MAHITDVQTTSSSSLWGTLAETITNMRVALEKHRQFNTMFNELNNLSDRELADLGISRSDIKRIALETVRAQ